jgi:hypothetical protein
MSGVLPNLAGLLARTTPGPWKTNDDWETYGGADRGESNWIQPHGAYSDKPADNELMAAAPLLAQALIDAGEALAVISPERLEALATWIDFVDAERGSKGGEVQADLRLMAVAARAVLVRLADIDKDIAAPSATGGDS